jgi:hypothetical protein
MKSYRLKRKNEELYEGSSLKTDTSGGDHVNFPQRVTLQFHTTRSM